MRIDRREFVVVLARAEQTTVNKGDSATNTTERKSKRPPGPCYNLNVPAQWDQTTVVGSLYCVVSSALSVSLTNTVQLNEFRHAFSPAV